MGSGILNEGMQAAGLPEKVLQTFTGRKAERRLFPSGYQLYKLTQHPLYRSNDTVTDFWSSVKPLGPDDPGLATTLTRSGRVGSSLKDFARARSAVSHEWNAMSGVLRARLTVPVYGFVGRCSAQRMYQNHSPNVVFIGGAYQIWIPNLTSQQIAYDSTNI